MCACEFVKISCSQIGKSILFFSAISALNFSQAFADELKITSGEFPPYSSSHLPDLGTHAEAIRKVYEGSGHTLSIEVQPWNRAYAGVKTGTKNASYPWLKTDERVKEVYYPKVPIETIVDVAVYKKDKFPKGLKIKSLKDLIKQKLRVVGVESYWYVAKMRAMGAKVMIASSPRDAYAIVMGGRADVHINVDKVIELELAEFYPDKKDRDQFEVSKVPLNSAPSYLVFSLKDPKHVELAAEWDKRAPPVLKKLGLK